MTRGGKDGVVAWAFAAHTLSAEATNGEVVEPRRDVSCVEPPRPVSEDAPLGATNAAMVERGRVEGEGVEHTHARAVSPYDQADDDEVDLGGTILASSSTQNPFPEIVT